MTLKCLLLLTSPPDVFVYIHVVDEPNSKAKLKLKLKMLRASDDQASTDQNACVIVEMV